MINSNDQTSVTGKIKETEKDVFVNLNDIKVLHNLSDAQEIELLQKVLDECEDVNKVKQLSQQILDIKTRQAEPEPDDGLSPALKIVKKWAKKLDGIDTDDGIKIVACMLENQYTHINDNFHIKSNKEDKDKRLAEIKTLQATLESLPEFAQKALQAEISKQLGNLPKSFEDTFEWKHVNILDEVVKFYDQLVCKNIVGIQPMVGPVGLSYTLRYRPEPTRIDITQDELVKQHNEGAEHDSGKMSKYDTFNDMPFHLKDKYKLQYYIEGINDGEKGLAKKYGEQVNLTVEQKEVVAKTMKLKLGYREKANSLVVARHTDLMVYSAIRKLRKDEVVEIPQKDLFIEILKLAEVICRKTKMGAGNQIICGSELPRDFMFQNKGAIKCTIDPLLKKDEIILAYKGTRENDCGVILNPYIPLMPQISIGNGIVEVDVPEKDPKGMLMTRFGLVDNLFGSDNYYEVIKITDFEEVGPKKDIDISEEQLADIEKKVKEGTDTKPFKVK
jgi:hypothetical protein